MEVARRARVLSLGDDAPPDAELWIACHGYRQLARPFLEPFRRIAEGSRTIVAPEALSRFYVEDALSGPHGPESRVAASWMTREDRENEIRDYVGYLDRVTEAWMERRRPDRVVAFGFSQGAATAARWAVLGRTSVDRLVLWAGGLPPDPAPATVADRLRTLRPILVAGSEDPWATPEALGRQVERMAALNVTCDVVRFRGGHRLSRDTLERVAALVRDEPDPSPNIR